MKRILVGLSILVGFGLLASQSWGLTRYSDTFTDYNYRQLQYHSPDVAVNSLTSYSAGENYKYYILNGYLYHALTVNTAHISTIFIGGCAYPLTTTAQVGGLTSYSGGEHGIVARYQDASNYWAVDMVGYQFSSTKLRIGKFIAGSYTNVTECVVPFYYNSPIYLRLLDTGYDFTLYADLSTDPATTLRLKCDTTELASPVTSYTGWRGTNEYMGTVLSYLKVDDSTASADPVATATPWPASRSVRVDTFNGVSNTPLGSVAPDLDDYGLGWGAETKWKLDGNGVARTAPDTDTTTSPARFDLGTKVGWPRIYQLRYSLRKTGVYLNSIGLIIRQGVSEYFRIALEETHPGFLYVVNGSTVLNQSSSFNSYAGNTYTAFVADYNDRVFMYHSNSDGSVPWQLVMATAVPTTTAGGVKLYSATSGPMSNWSFYDSITISANPLEATATRTPTPTPIPTATPTPTVTASPTITATPRTTSGRKQRFKWWPYQW